jgi:hypothetical protein
MKVVPQRDIDGVDIAVGEERIVRAVGALRAPSDAIGLGRFGAAAGDGGETGVSGAEKSGDRESVDPCRADNAPTHLFRFTHRRVTFSL